MPSAQNPKDVQRVISIDIVLGWFNIITQELAGTFNSNLHRGLTHSPHSFQFTAVGKQVQSYCPPYSAHLGSHIDLKYVQIKWYLGKITSC